MASFLHVSRFWVSKVDCSSLMINGVYFERSVSWEPFQPSFSLRLLRFVLFILNVHSLPELQVLLVDLPVQLVVLLCISLLELRNVLGSLSEGIIMNGLQSIHQGFCHLDTSKKSFCGTKVTTKINVALLQLDGIH